MKTLLKETLTSILATIVFAIVLCGAYPVIIWCFGQLLFPYQANGSLIESGDRSIIGSAWLGQNFATDKYFHPRPSAAGNNGYDPTSSGGSNLGPTSQTLITTVKQRVSDYRKDNSVPDSTLIPADAVTASASGLDPHISVQNALLQAPRVAKTRGLSVDAVNAEIAKATDGRSLGIFGEPGVNVLKLNLALDNGGGH